MNERDEREDIPGDEALRALYRTLPSEEPGPRIDAAIRAAAREALAADQPTRWWHGLRWQLPLAAAATAAMTLMLMRDVPMDRTAALDATTLEAEIAVPPATVAAAPPPAAARGIVSLPWPFGLAPDLAPEAACRHIAGTIDAVCRAERTEDEALQVHLESADGRSLRHTILEELRRSDWQGGEGVASDAAEVFVSPGGGGGRVLLHREGDVVTLRLSGD